MSWRGLWVIVVTPFTDEHELDEPALRRVVRFCIDCGVHGLVGPANASEYTTLSDDERRRWLRTVLDEAGGKTPVLATVTAGHWRPAAELARFAQDAGATGIMSMPPHILKAGPDGCFEYYRRLAEAVRIPVCVQNFYEPVGTPMTPALLARLCAEVPNVHYIKEETLPESRNVSSTLRAAGANCKGVFGGQGGLYMIDEHRRGACGNMPACHTADVLVQVWDQLEAGRTDEARRLFNRVLPLINYERQYGVAIYKDVLFRRGVISTRICRAPGRSLDAEDQAEMDQLMDGIAPLFTVAKV